MYFITFSEMVGTTGRAIAKEVATESKLKKGE